MKIQAYKDDWLGYFPLSHRARNGLYRAGARQIRGLLWLLRREDPMARLLRMKGIGPKTAIEIIKFGKSIDLIDEPRESKNA